MSINIFLSSSDLAGLVTINRISVIDRVLTESLHACTEALVFLVVVSSECDNGYLLLEHSIAHPLAQLLGCFEAVEDGHLVVHDDESDALAASLLVVLSHDVDALLPVASLHALQVKQSAYHLSQDESIVVYVVHHQDLRAA